MNVTLITAKLNGEIGRDNFDIMKATLAKDVQEIQATQRAMTAEAEMFLHLTVDTSRALWVAAPRSEKQTVQSVLFPEGICCPKDLGSLHQSRMNWSCCIQKSFGTCRPRGGIRSWMLGLGRLGPPTSRISGAFGRPVTTIHKAP
jgi:hypothetical protein